MTLPQTFSDLSKRYSLLLAMPDVEAGFSFTRSDMEAIGEALKIAARVMDGETIKRAIDWDWDGDMDDEGEEAQRVVVAALTGDTP